MNRSSASLLVLLVLVGCGAEPASGPGGPSVPTALTDTAVPESWVVPQWSPSYWFVLADVRGFVGEERWSALDTAWMEKEARADLIEFGPKNQNTFEHMYAGLWRLGLLREELLAVLAEIDGEASWPLDTPGNRLLVAWRPRVERWRRAHTDEDIRAKLDSSWRDALAAGNPNVAAKVVEAYDTWVETAVADALAPDAERLARAGLAAIEEGLLPPGVLFLLERFGVPDGVDLSPVLAAVRRRYVDYEDEVMPLPHPFDLHLQCLRLERLMDGQ